MDGKRAQAMFVCMLIGLHVFEGIAQQKALSETKVYQMEASWIISGHDTITVRYQTNAWRVILANTG